MEELRNRLEDVVDAHGPWTAMSIKLSDDVCTREPAVDHRLKRILQACSDVAGKPLAACRVLDLACLEGHYALEFARHGSEVVGIEGRRASVAKCDFARDAMGLERASFHQDDVRNLSVEKYGVFDIVICSGLLYHLPAPDAWRLIQSMHSVCRGIVVIDTFVALSSRIDVELDGAAYHGHVYGEHDATESQAQKAKKLWASLDNDSSFWFTEPSLLNLLARAGYSSAFEVLTPTMPGNLRDRKTYLAVKGRPGRRAHVRPDRPPAARRHPGRRQSAHGPVPGPARPGVHDGQAHPPARGQGRHQAGLAGDQGPATRSDPGFPAGRHAKVTAEV